MNVNLQRMVPTYCYPEELGELEYFIQFNVYETIDYKNDILKDIKETYDLVCFCERDLDICKIGHTSPRLNIISTKIINTIEGTSIEGQHLTGKKIVIIGELELSLIIYYCTDYDGYNQFVKDISIPFSTFIMIPKDICNLGDINLRYFIEDVSLAYLCTTRVLVSTTLLIQYVDEY
ncbi:hypothetical protein [Paraclostridium bifermentans]|uniref:hypothetical protein n=1 Tax=Paraclostridium bifermentans TaxID=1490 RepID=UPI00359C4084